MSEFSDNAKFILATTHNKLLLRQKQEGMVNPEIIREELGKISSLFPEQKADTDVDACYSELLRQFSVTSTPSAVLKDTKEHVAWLTEERKKDWRYWPRHLAWLEKEAELAVNDIEEIDESTDTILGLLEDPERKGAWDRRGLVVGSIQSGKTENYAALICKAADAGYKVIIVLAGLYNSLRSQTQIRLEKAFLGFTTNENNPKGLVGVGLYDQDFSITPNCGTNQKEKGDFSRRAMVNFSITPESRPWLFVVKKNKYVLENIVKWLKGITNSTGKDKKINLDFPLLLIDDESDNASVDTEEGSVVGDIANEDHNPKTINRLIRTILKYFNKKAYVGYTATPFANIFIHDLAHTTDEGQDLYPSSFIINLGISSEYIGPEKVFGNDAYCNETIRCVTDSADWLPSKQNVDSFLLSNSLPESLQEAIQAFILCCAARCCRGDGTKHCSMLVHVTRINNLQSQVYEQIRKYLKDIQRRINRRINDQLIRDSLRSLWESDFQSSMKWFRDNSPEDAGRYVSWEEILPVLRNVVMDITVSCVNGRAKDALDYENHRETGYKVIAVGGNKLSRGLTLEGLSVSYFIRPSKMYDTLMQMGRWFGYHSGYADLCRLYTTLGLCQSYRYITEATAELREEFEVMSAMGETPKSFGLKVRTHPALLVTSPMKMRTAHDIRVSFSGTAPETVTFLPEENARKDNLRCVSDFLRSLGTPSEINPSRTTGKLSSRSWKGFLWHNVFSRQIMDWLENYHSPAEAYRTNPAHLVEFIREMNKVSELTTWDVYLNNSGRIKDNIWKVSDDIEVVRPLRQWENASERYNIKRLLGANEEEMLLDGEAWEEALEMTQITYRARGQHSKVPQYPSGYAIRAVCGFGSRSFEPRPDRGMLILYIFDVCSDKEIMTKDLPLVGFTLSLPESHKGRVVTYKATSIFWRDYDGS